MRTYERSDSSTRISLLHATYHREGGVQEVISNWLQMAKFPNRIEYVLANDDDDPVSFFHPFGGIVIQVRNEPDDQWSTAVRNWNAAAAAASGDLLFVVSDDLTPLQFWDTQLDLIAARLNPSRLSYAVKIKDSPSNTDALLRHPIVSKKFYETFGLFNPSFSGVFCDNDLTAKAFWKSIIIDGRFIEVKHIHPLYSKESLSISQQRINRSIEYQRGRNIMEKQWRPHQWQINFRLVGLKQIGGTSKIFWLKIENRAKAILLFLVHSNAKKLLRLFR